MAAGSWKVYWREYADNSYLYGTELLFHAKDDVEFRNELVPPGTVLKRWYSKTNFQARRTEPTLPIIDGESHYRIETDIDTPDGEGYLVRLVFYDRYEAEAGSEFLRSSSQEFRCPLKTYSYEVQLIGAGTKTLHFHSFTITELTDEEQKTLSDPESGKKLARKNRKADRRRTAGKNGRV